MSDINDPAGSYANGPHRNPYTTLATGLLYVGGAFMVPPTRKARWSYILIIPLLITGCYFLRDGGDTPASDSSWWWYGEYHQTPASWFFFALSIASFLSLNAEFNKHNRARRAAAYQAEVEAQAVAWIDQEPRTIVEVVSSRSYEPETEESPTAPAEPTSTLILPTWHDRRVRRGGTTLGGTPIKDRRSVNPDTL